MYMEEMVPHQQSNTVISKRDLISRLKFRYDGRRRTAKLWILLSQLSSLNADVEICVHSREKFYIDKWVLPELNLLLNHFSYKGLKRKRGNKWNKRWRREERGSN